jgi:transcriptional regulator with XRE-family HTH domain
MGILVRLGGLSNRRRILPMLAIRITGNQLRAGRALADLSMKDLASRAHLSRRTLSKWEGSSNAAVDAVVAHLSRALDVLEAEGIRFADSGVYLHRSTVLPSDERPGRPAILNNGAVA